jgi:hypothetical protein
MMAALIVVFGIASVVAGITGVVCAVRSARAKRAQKWCASGAWGTAGLLLLLVPVWLWACAWAEARALKGALRCSAILRQVVYPAILENRLRYAGEPLPAKWAETGPEPMCNGSGAPLPYVYLPVPDLGQAAQADPPAVIAHCPWRHKRAWWVPRFMPHADRCVLDATGAAHGLTEAEFQRRLRAAPTVQAK